MQVLRTLARAARPMRAVEIALSTRLPASSVRVYLERLREGGSVEATGERTLRTWRPTRSGRRRAAAPIRRRGAAA